MFEEDFAKENVFHNKKMLFLCYASGKGTIYLIILHTLNITSENQITLDQRSINAGRTFVYNFRERSLFARKAELLLGRMIS